jgi:hypothetical protein
MYWSSDRASSTQIIFDVTGYFTADQSGAHYYTVSPARLLDSRINLGAQRFYSQVPQGLAVASGGEIAVTGNLTVTAQSQAGYVTAAPSLASYTAPSTSTLNFPRGDTRANGAVVPLADGYWFALIYWASSRASSTQLIFDLTGYFA